MITNKAVIRAIDYILQHIEEEICLDDVAKHCHFSRYYFSRLFKAQTGESVYEFIRRVKLEKSAFRLKTEKRHSITEIGADYGYSSSNYSSAFRQHYHMAPAVFRRNSYRKSLEHPFFHCEKQRMENFEECGRKITVEKLLDYRVIYERHLGSYERLSRDWNRFIEKHREAITEETIFFERTYDDPAVTDTEKCISDICMSVGKDYPTEDTLTLRGGRCIVYHFKGHAKHIYGAYQTIFLEWLPRTNFELDTNRYLFDRYHTVDGSAMYMELDICLPVRERA